MTQLWQGLVAVGVIAGLSGCARVQTHLVEMPRVDQEVAGNQGYLAGTGSSAARPSRKTTRQVVMTDVELMTGQEIKQGLRRPAAPIKGELGPQGRGWKMPEPAPMQVQVAEAPMPAVEPLAPPSPADTMMEMDLPEPMITDSPATTPVPATYVVQPNDTLEKIAKKVYGSYRRWPRIYKANRELIKNPNVLRTGLRLTIPPLPSDEAQTP